MQFFVSLWESLACNTHLPPWLVWILGGVGLMGTVLCLWILVLRALKSFAQLRIEKNWKKRVRPRNARGVSFEDRLEELFVRSF